MDITILYSHFLASTGITTDTRSIGDGTIFFALKGDNFNGNEFAAIALEKGASHVVIDEQDYAIDQRCIVVNDVLSTLQALAHHHRQHLGLPVIAITGSNGKTTTKELMRDVLRKKYITLATKGNLNNHIGVPLTLLTLEEQHEIAIIEMGASHLEEIALLAQIAAPDYGLITNIGIAHIGEFGSRGNIIKAKCELYDYLRTTRAKAFVDGSSALLMEKSEGLDRIIYDEQANDSMSASILSADPLLTIEWSGQIIKTQLIGDYNLPNINAAIAIGSFFEVDAADICAALKEYTPENNRSQLISRGNTRIIMDAYNANPDSMEVALKNLSKMNADKKLAILGDMLELGEESMTAHRDLIDQTQALGIESIFVGAELLSHSAGKPNFYKNALEAADKLKDYDLSYTLVLIKGSRGIRLEQLLDVI